MPGIVTITFSPCIDKSASVETLLPEKKLRCSSPRMEPGGGGINVARAARKLGAAATAIYPAGGYTGQYFNQLVAADQVPSIIIPTRLETRENIIILERSTNRQFRFGMPATELNEEECRQILAAVENIPDMAFLVVSGSLAPGVPADILSRIALIARKKKAWLIADTGAETVRAAQGKGVFLIKPNLGELSALAGKDYLQNDEITPAARKLIDEGIAEVVVVSMGQNGARLVSKDEICQMVPPVVERKSTVGAGDSMVAGIVVALSNGRHLHDAVRFGVACGTAATMNPGTELCHRADADDLYTKVTAGEPALAN